MGETKIAFGRWARVLVASAGGDAAAVVATGEADGAILKARRRERAVCACLWSECWRRRGGGRGDRRGRWSDDGRELSAAWPVVRGQFTLKQ